MACKVFQIEHVYGLVEAGRWFGIEHGYGLVEALIAWTISLKIW